MCQSSRIQRPGEKIPQGLRFLAVRKSDMGKLSITSARDKKTGVSESHCNAAAVDTRASTIKVGDNGAGIEKL